MKIMEFLQKVCDKLNAKCLQQFGFNAKDVAFGKIVDYMYAPKDSSSLAVARILFGLAMLFDIPDERGGASMAKRWGDPKMCHFPLLPILLPMPLPYMALVYAAMWLGAVGIMLGYKYSIAAPTFTVCYWYLLLIEKSFWNNHSYLFGLVALLIGCTEANSYWSLDAYLDPSKKKATVPYWNYFVLKYQFFILYFMAGMKKGTAEWLTGYSVQNLSEHWVFGPFKYFLTVRQTDYLVVHWFVFMFDLTIALWMMWAYTRHVAMVFCALFHLMNSRLFSIGMFPWVCLATMPLFYPFDWPKKVAIYFKTHYCKTKSFLVTTFRKLRLAATRQLRTIEVETDTDDFNFDQTNEINQTANEESIDNTSEEFNVGESNRIRTIDAILKYHNAAQENDNTDDDNDDEVKPKDKTNDSPKKKRTIYLIVCYMLIQAFLPYSHFITKGYNNWTDGLYGYSWDMMVHTWDSSSVVIKVVDNDSKAETFVKPEKYVPNERWSRHGDMILQYAQCLKKILMKEPTETNCDDRSLSKNQNISIYVDVWCAMNGRFVQRMFDPKVDLLQATWSPFTKVSYLMPLLDEATHLRKVIDEIRNDVHSWSNRSDVVFYADFPGYDHEKYIPKGFQNVTLTILEGTVVYEPEVNTNRIGLSYKLTSYDNINISSGTFHKVINIGAKPAYYMYTFFNKTESNVENLRDVKSKLPIVSELYRRFYGMFIFVNFVVTNLFQMFSFSECIVTLRK